MVQTNENALLHWQSARHPSGWQGAAGRFVRLEVLSLAHVSSLYVAYSSAGGAANWAYLPYGPFATETEFRYWVSGLLANDDPYFLAVVDSNNGQCIGIASFLRISADIGVIEVGHIHFSPLLQRRIGATEAIYLMMQWVFSNGYRRLEWKCNALNASSRGAAQRFGFSYEGTFRQASIVKGVNRDTAWFAILDRQWARLHAVYQIWLAPENFDESHQQLCSLRDLTAPILYANDIPYKQLNL